MSRCSQIALLVCAALAGCASTRVPARIENVIAKLQCGMTTLEVEKIAGTNLRPQGLRPWGTHILKEGSTDIWLQFEDDRLEATQVATLDGLMRMKLWPRSELCGSSESIPKDGEYSQR